MLNNRGFSLVELIVVMAIFIGLIMISTNAFENILGRAGQQIKSAETQTEGIVGLEMLRSDLEHIGYGLPWTIPNPPAAPGFDETTADPVTGIASSAFRDITPRAVQVGLAPSGSKVIDSPGTNNSNPGAAYLVIKSTRVALHDTAKKWAYVNYSSGSSSYVKQWGTSDDFIAGERVITLSTTFSTDGIPGRRLVMKSATEYSYALTAAPPVQPADNAYMPGDASQLYVVYGVEGAGGGALRMPYNRADYYVKKPATGRPEGCNPGSGILIKGVVRHSGGYDEYPLLNCVGDMQVGFDLDTGYSSTLTGMSAADIRDRLKGVKVYILAHEGKKDRNYSYPPIDSTNAIFVGPYIGTTPSTVEGRMWTQDAMAQTFGLDWKNYRWKIYTIVGRPKNLK